MCAGPWAWARARARAPAMSQDGGAGRVKGTGPLPQPRVDCARGTPRLGGDRARVPRARRGRGARRRGGDRLPEREPSGGGSGPGCHGLGGGAAGQMQGWGRGELPLSGAEAQGAGTRGYRSDLVVGAGGRGRPRSKLLRGRRGRVTEAARCDSRGQMWGWHGGRGTGCGGACGGAAEGMAAPGLPLASEPREVPAGGGGPGGGAARAAGSRAGRKPLP